jgi:hypothetical protein
MMPFVLSQCAKKPEVDHRSRTEPTADRVSFEEGAALYGKQCASCHGPEGLGAIGPRLNDASCKSCGDEGKLIDVIAHTMPPANPTSCDKTCATLVAQYIRAELYLKSAESCEESSIVPGKRAVRLLTNREYDNTVRTLFQLPEGMSPASSFLKETKVEGFSTNHQEAVASTRRVEDWLMAAQSVVAQANLEKALSCDFNRDPRCVLGNFATRMFRRPLTPTESQHYSTLINDKGVKTALMAMLVDPAFLYRSELGVLKDDGTYHLTPYEIASALSYMFLETAPDDQLLKLAADGSLLDKTVIRAQAQRLVQMPEAKRMTAQFAVEWLDVGKIAEGTNVNASPDAGMRLHMLNETKAMFNYITFDAKSRRFEDLLTANFTYLPADLARYYGLQFPANAGDFAITPLDGQRAGILGHGSVLVATSHPDQSSPILRGLFVRDRLLCQKLPSPPANLNIIVPKVDPTLSTRERFAQHTTEAACQNCHQYIDGLGFGFENFDATGRFRSMENGKPVDSSGRITNLNDLSLKPQVHQDFSSLPELAQILSSSPAAKECFAFQFYRYSRGVAGQAQDRCASRKANQKFIEGGQTIADMMVEQTQAPGFVLKK